ncbi:hypothetical protein I3G73_000709 [Salmonella enterica]|nr:hypothetical protein [Salmonella enterica]EDT7594674.1 hypothetical protein [Salmonella enterica subsp. enterica serovar Bovismorbificans]EGG7955499.1 hypothetical protein [Salmonella enterica]EGP3547656.1 hypothetical protein [Salmonella enterica]EGS9944680.1 hypothetical protein [Salmonella enterica]
MFKDKISAVVGFVKENATPASMASAVVTGLAVAAAPAFAVGETSTSLQPFSLTADMVNPIVSALAANFGVALTAAFGLLAVTLVGKAAFGVVKGVISRAF